MQIEWLLIAPAIFGLGFLLGYFVRARISWRRRRSRYAGRAQCDCIGGRAAADEDGVHHARKVHHAYRGRDCVAFERCGARGSAAPIIPRPAIRFTAATNPTAGRPIGTALPMAAGSGNSRRAQ
jgi:hypothetical protein